MLPTARQKKIQTTEIKIQISVCREEATVRKTYIDFDGSKTFKFFGKNWLNSRKSIDYKKSM